MNTLGTRLRRARKDARMSQVTLAKYVGVTQPTISDLEKGVSKDMDASTLIGVTRALNIRPDWLMLGEEPMRDFADDVVEVVSLFRALVPSNRAALLAAGRALLSSQQDSEPDGDRPPAASSPRTH